MKLTPMTSRLAGVLCLALVALLAPACETSDPTAPAESTISVDADPQTLVVPTGTMATTDLTATLRSKTGVRLPDHEMTFSTTVGDLVPVAGTVLFTDDNGQAKSTLATSQTATVTARSGGITGTTQVQTTPVAVGLVMLEVENDDPTCTGQKLCACSQDLILTATVFDVAGDLAPGVDVKFNLLTPTDPNSSTGPSNIAGDRTGTSGATLGIASTAWTPNQTDCSQRCATPGVCMWTFRASAGVTTSNEVTVTESF